MKILIISLPRTGSTSLLHKIAVERNLEPIYEPFNHRHTNISYNQNIKNVVVKSIINQKPPDVSYDDGLTWLFKFANEFDEVILLSRKDLRKCAESYAYMCHHYETRGFRHFEEYRWEPTPNLSQMQEEIEIMHSEIEELSLSLKVPITYYENIYDEKSSHRLRKN